jgi:hypothetical protein
MQPRFNMAKGYVFLLIVIINLTMDGTRPLASPATVARIAGSGGTHPWRWLAGDGGKWRYGAWFMTVPRGKMTSEGRRRLPTSFPGRTDGDVCRRRWHDFFELDRCRQ